MERWGAADVPELLFSFARIEFAFSEELGEALQRQAVVAFHVIPPAAIPRVMGALAAMRVRPYWVLMQALQDAACEAANLFSGLEVLALLKSVAALGVKTLPTFVDAMQQRAAEACRDLEVGDILGLLHTLSEMREVPSASLVTAIEGRVMEQVERFGDPGETCLRLAEHLDRMQVATSPEFDAAVRPNFPISQHDHFATSHHDHFATSQHDHFAAPASTAISQHDHFTARGFHPSAIEPAPATPLGPSRSTEGTPRGPSISRDPRAKSKVEDSSTFGGMSGVPAGRRPAVAAFASGVVEAENGWRAPARLELSEYTRPLALGVSFEATPDQRRAVEYNLARARRQFGSAKEIPPDPEGVDFDIPGIPSDDLRRAIPVSKESDQGSA